MIVASYPNAPDLEGGYNTRGRLKKFIMKVKREINTHEVNPANVTLDISVLDEPGDGGACYSYVITGYDVKTNASALFQNTSNETRVLFQNGPIPQKGVNGITHEALLAIVEDRLNSFQEGPFACEENQKALDAVKEAQHWLQFRTLKRIARGVEGTHTK